MDGRGPITYVQGKDNSNVVRPLVAKWNAAHPTENVTFKEQSDQADQQHDDLVQNLQAKNVNYDVMSVDVIWTAEFAAKGWLQPLTGKTAIDTVAMLPATVKASTYKNVLYAAPVSSDGGILFYRKDLVPTPPKTWTEMMGMCSIAKAKNIGCYAGQLFKYEGLTVNTAEAIKLGRWHDHRRRREADACHARGEKGHGEPGDRLRGRDPQSRTRSAWHHFLVRPAPAHPRSVDTTRRSASTPGTRPPRLTS